MDIKNALSTFNLDEKEQQVFLLLSKFQWITALELSKHTEISRTTLYRILERLIKKGLIQVQIGDDTTRYNTSAFESFSSLLLEQKKILDQQEQALRTLQAFMSSQEEISTKTTVRFYEGVRGLKQLEWKRTQIPNTTMMDFGTSNWWQYVGQDTAEEVRQRLVEQNIVVKEIHNPDFYDAIEDPATATWTKNSTFITHHYQHRTLPKVELPIESDLLLIGDTIHLQSYTPNDTMGIEIVSKHYANMLKHCFMLLWNRAEVIDAFGGEDFIF